LVLLLCLGLPAQPADVYSAETVKSAFLYRFTGYVDWPAAALDRPEFTIAVLGADTVAEELARFVPGRPIKNLPARVLAIHAIHEAASAQLLYVGPAYRGPLREVTDALGGKPVLIVTDREGALDEGSSVNFLLVDRRVRFEVSLAAATKAGLRIDPALLAVAAQVRGGPRSDEGYPSIAAGSVHRPAAPTVAGQ
jgi:hypothetical protein